MLQIDQVWDGDTIAVPKRGLHLACCDCGLTHTIKPVVQKTARGTEVRLRINVNKRETKRVRRRAHRELLKGDKR